MSFFLGINSNLFRSKGPQCPQLAYGSEKCGYVHKYLYRENEKAKGARYKQLVNLGKGYMADP